MGQVETDSRSITELITEAEGICGSIIRTNPIDFSQEIRQIDGIMTRISALIQADRTIAQQVDTEVQRLSVLITSLVAAEVKKKLIPNSLNAVQEQIKGWEQLKEAAQSKKGSYSSNLSYENWIQPSEVRVLLNKIRQALTVEDRQVVDVEQLVTQIMNELQRIKDQQ